MKGMEPNIFMANIVSCPNCNHTFSYNKINGIALIEAVNHIEARKRMYCRLSLDALEKLEKEDKLTFLASKKVILDNFNDLTRDVQTILGLGLGVE